MAWQLLFMLLKTTDEKEGGFDSISKIFGVQIDLIDAYLRVAVVGNVGGRVREIVAKVDSFLGKGCITIAKMRALRGQLVFAESQILERWPALT